MKLNSMELYLENPELIMSAWDYYGDLHSGDIPRCFLYSTSCLG